MRIFSIFSLVLLLLYSNCFAQREKTDFVQSPQSDSLKFLSSIMYGGKTDMERYEANNRFLEMLKNDLIDENTINFKYDSVKTLSVLLSVNKKFKLFTWGLPIADNKYDIFGIILFYSEKSGKYKYLELQDVSKILEYPEKEVLKKGMWFGAIYYQMIEHKVSNNKIYTLIGWNAGNGLWQQKVIDILFFDSRGEPVFGKLMFRGRGYTSNKRIVINYANNVFLKMLYENVTYSTVFVKEKHRYNKKINTNNNVALKAPKKKKIVKTTTTPMIVFDNVKTKYPSLEGQYQYYYPASDKSHGFYFKDGKWMYKSLDVPVDTLPMKKIKNGLLPPE